ncbi:hypothetical protein X975_07879, partial [Stegodyphus mimosarum]
MPPCIRERCKEPPPPILNGHVVNFTGEHGSIARYECKEFYHLKQSRYTRVRCLFGKWEGRLPECKDSGTAYVEAGDTAASTSKPSVPRTVVVTEVPSTEPNLNFLKTTRQPTTSSSTNGNCEISTIRNGALTVRRLGPRYLTSNGWVRDDRYEKIPVGTEVSSGNTSHLQCFDGYSFQGSGSSVLTVICLEGKWYPHPVCLPRSCEISTIRNGALTARRVGPMHLTRNGWVRDDIYEKIPVGTVISSGNTSYLHCFNGVSFQRSGSSVLPVTCQKGKWYPDPVCLPRKQQNSGTCYLKDLRLKMGVSNESREVTNHDDYLYVVCSHEYTPTGERPLCFEGRWNESVLSPCRERGCEISTFHNGVLTEQRLGTQFWTRNGRVRDHVFEEIPVGTLISSGHTRHLHCFDGYSFQGSGSSVLPITCQKGKWYPDPVCLPDGVPYVEGVVPAAPTLKSTAPKTVAEAEVPSTESSLEFSKTTTLPPTSSSTDEGLCEAPVAPENGMIVIKPSVPRIGSIVSYWCHEGFRLQGSQSAKCLETGQWTSPAPKCLQPCKIPDFISHGKIGVYKTSRYFRRTAKFETISTGARIKDGEFVLRCDKNYEVIGAGTAEKKVECRGGAWSDNLKCVPDGIPYVEGVVTGASISNPSVRRTIPVAEAPSTESSLKFSKTTTLPPTSSSTDGLPCSLESLYQRLPEDVVIVGDQLLNDIVPYGTSLQLTCQDGLRLRGRAEAKCEGDQKWKIPSVRCVPGCGRIPKAADSRLIIEPEKEFYVLGESAKFSCPPGLTLTSELHRVMCLSGTWSAEEFPDCEVV